MNESVCSILDERDEIELVEFRIFVAVFYRHVQLKKQNKYLKDTSKLMSYQGH